MEINNKDDILARLSSGEQVASNPALEILGRDLIPAANRLALAQKKGGTMQHFKHGSLHPKGVQPKKKKIRKSKHVQALPRMAQGMDEMEMPNDSDQAMEGMEGYATGTNIAGVQRVGNSFGRPAGYVAPARTAPTETVPLPAGLPQQPRMTGNSYTPPDTSFGVVDWEKTYANRGYSDPNAVQGVNPNITGSQTGLSVTVPGYKDGTDINGVQREGNSFSHVPGYTPPSLPKVSVQADYTQPSQEEVMKKLQDYRNNGQPQKFAQGSQNPQGVQKPQGLPQNPKPNPQAESAPTLEQAKRNYELQFGPLKTEFGAKVKGYADGVRDPRGVGYDDTKDSPVFDFIANANRNNFNPIQGAKELVGMSNTASHSLANQFRDVANVGSGLASTIGNAVKPYLPAPQLPQATTQAQPVQQQVPSLPTSNGMTPGGNGNPGVPYTVNKNTANFTNPDGTGSGSITAPNMAQRMSDGKGSFNVMHLESPSGGKPQPAPSLPQQITMQQAPDYSGQVQQYLSQLNTQPLGGGFDEALHAKQMRESARSGLNALLGAQQNDQQYAVNQNRNAIDQSQFNQKLNFDQGQADFANNMATQEMGLKQAAGVAGAQNEAAKLNLEQQKALSGITKGQFLQALQHGIATGKVDHPDFQKLLQTYQQIYGNGGGLDSLMGAAPA